MCVCGGGGGQETASVACCVCTQVRARLAWDTDLGSETTANDGHLLSACDLKHPLLSALYFSAEVMTTAHPIMI